VNFKNDSQRRAMFANINKFSLFDRFRHDDYFVNKRNELVYKMNDRRGDYSDKDLMKMSDKLNKLNAKIRGRESRETYEESHGPVRRIVDSAVDIVHEPKAEYNTVGRVSESVQPVVVERELPAVEREYPVMVEQERPQVIVEQKPVKKSFGKIADAIVNLYPEPFGE
jgi:hypothetical protein